MKERSKVLYVSQEISPYLPESPMAEVGRAIPQHTQEWGYEVRTFMPKYGCINERRNQLHEVIRLSGMNVVIDDTDHPLIIKVATLQPTRMQVYFIDNDDYFHYSPDKSLETVSSPSDNDERTIFFARGVLETVKKLRWNPSIVHCMGWITALIPVLVKKYMAEDPTFAQAKIVYALRSENFDQPFAERFYDKLNRSVSAPEAAEGQEPVDYLALNKLALDYCDAIVEMDENVDSELLEYAKATQKPLLSYIADKELFKESYKAFFESLIEQ
ncbi:MAG: glycogen/starch synthase [Muribaculaceae bacterium]|nr:glycogen/starch synthase [Muribaculaceae bacterium]